MQVRAVGVATARLRAVRCGPESSCDAGPIATEEPPHGFEPRLKMAAHARDYGAGRMPVAR
jgi:hypothetical protein